MSIQQGLPLPDAISNAPEIFVGLQLFLSGFLELNDERQIGFGAGPIPWHAILAYCQEHEIVGEQAEDFFYFVKQLDAEYLRIQAEKEEK